MSRQDLLERHPLPSGRALPIPSPCRFLAAKCAALIDRGGEHWYESTDFEDIVLLLESHADLASWLARGPGDAVDAVARWAEAATQRPYIREEIEGTITRGPHMDARAGAVYERLLWLAHR
jgi:hypothetical protein